MLCLMKILKGIAEFFNKYLECWNNLKAENKTYFGNNRNVLFEWNENNEKGWFSYIYFYLFFI